MTGNLYIIGTPIGNLSDITLRAIETLKKVDVIAAEDTRNTRKLMTRFEIKTRLISFHEHNKMSACYLIIEKYLLKGQNVGLVSDAGMPIICDPGFELIRAAINCGINVTTVPSATAFVSAAVLSGFVNGGFIFDGFLPNDTKAKKEILTGIINETRDLIFYEAPHRLIKTLKTMLEVLGDRRIALARELTKLYEEVLRLTISEALLYYEKTPPKGEYVIVVKGRSTEELKQEAIDRNRSIDLKEQLNIYLDEGLAKKDAIKRLAKERGLNKRDVYKELL